MCIHLCWYFYVYACLIERLTFFFYTLQFFSSLSLSEFLFTSLPLLTLSWSLCVCGGGVDLVRTWVLCPSSCPRSGCVCTGACGRPYTATATALSAASSTLCARLRRQRLLHTLLCLPLKLVVRMITLALAPARAKTPATGKASKRRAAVVTEAQHLPFDGAWCCAATL